MPWQLLLWLNQGSSHISSFWLGKGHWKKTALLTNPPPALCVQCSSALAGSTLPGRQCEPGECVVVRLWSSRSLVSSAAPALQGQRGWGLKWG